MTSPAITVENEMLPLTAAQTAVAEIVKRRTMRPTWQVILGRVAVVVSLVAVLMSFAGLVTGKCSCNLLWVYVSIYCTSLLLYVMAWAGTPT